MLAEGQPAAGSAGEGRAEQPRRDRPGAGGTAQPGAELGRGGGRGGARRGPGRGQSRGRLAERRGAGDGSPALCAASRWQSAPRSALGGRRARTGDDRVTGVVSPSQPGRGVPAAGAENRRVSGSESPAERPRRRQRGGS